MRTIVIPFLRKIEAEIKCDPEQALVAALKLHRTSAMEELYRKYSSSLMGIISRMVRDDEVSEDILQETFIKVWRNISQYDQSKGRFFTWLANITRNTAIDHLRSKAATNAKNTSDISDLNNSELDHACYWANIETIGVKKLLGKLKHDQQEILELFYFKGFTHTQVAEALSIPTGTVKTKIRQAILTLRVMFNETALTERRA